MSIHVVIRTLSRSAIVGLFGIPCLSQLLMGCVTLSATPSNDALFEQYEVVTGSAKRQTILAGFFRGNAAAELAVVHIDENSDRRLQLYGFDGEVWVSVLEATLRPDLLFVDVINVGGHDRLITYLRGRVNWFDPESVTERTLVEVAADYNATHDGGIPHVDITRDVNHDGRDDLVVPDVDGFWVSTQLGDGSFGKAVKLGPPEPFIDDIGVDHSHSYAEVGITAETIPWYLSRIHELDCNLDGRWDLVFWNKDHFEVHYQNERGEFDRVAEAFTLDVPFNFDGTYALMFAFSKQNILALLSGVGEITTRTVLHSVRDLNGDRVADLVIQILEGPNILKQRSVYEVHFGTPSGGRILFARSADTAIQPHGKAGGMQASGYSSQCFQDFDGDGQIDIMFKEVHVGFGGMIRALVGKSVPIDLEFYRMEDGLYSDEPCATRRIRRFAPLDGMGNVFFPTVLAGDVNGDGRSDLLVGQTPEELHIFMGVPGPDLFAQHPQRVAVGLPHDERNTCLVNLNNDRKQDLLMYHAPAQPDRITVLIAR